tara:strand:+ start:343 stop:534 length:192 start_codon:yes stop_codon:yes gene_type:complete
MIFFVLNQYCIKKYDVINIAGLKSKFIGKFLTVLLIETPPSKYGNVGFIATPCGKIEWICVIV